MDNEHRCRLFYDGDGYVRIPVDEYYDDDGNLHKAKSEDARQWAGPEGQTKGVSNIEISITLRNL